MGVSYRCVCSKLLGRTNGSGMAAKAYRYYAIFILVVKASSKLRRNLQSSMYKLNPI